MSATRGEHVPECPVTKLAASTAHNTLGCRCDVCVEFRQGYQRKQYRKGGAGYKGTVLRNSKARAGKLGIEHTLTQETIPEIPECCPALGTPLVIGGRGADGTRNSPSLDRLDNTEGYTPDNVTWMSLRANAIKTDATLSEIYQVADWLHGELKKRGIDPTTAGARR